MSIVEVDGTYERGRIKLSKKPKGVKVPSRVVVRFLDVEEEAEAARMNAVEKMLARMRKGIKFGGPPYPTREEIYGDGTGYVSRSQVPGASAPAGL